MRKVLKHHVPFGGYENQPVTVMTSGPIIHAGVQEERVVIWTETRIGVPEKPRYYIIYPTGVPIDEGAQHVASVQTTFGLVWHLYEKIV